VTQAPRTPTTIAAELYLLLFPAGHLVFTPVAGALATAADVALGLLVLTWAVELLARPGRRSDVARALRGEARPGLPSRRYLLGVLVLTALGAWVAASALWGEQPRYALAKGVAFAALGLGALTLATSGIGWRRAVDAWLGGAALALLLTLLAGVAGPDVLRARMLHGGLGILGLPFPRISGPFLHPNMMGDWLLVSGLLLWGRWPELTGPARRRTGVLALAMAAAFALTASTAAIAAGVLAAWWGRGAARSGAHAGGLLVGVGGVALAVATFVLLVVPLDLSVLGLELETGGIRPAIWRSSLDALVQSPVLGVGAAPYIAEAADRLRGGAMGLWDAHNAYLSIAGQFGLAGLGIAAAGAWLAVTGALGGAGRGAAAAADPFVARRRTAVRLALIAVAINALFLASEDLRHVWALVGVAGVLAAEGS